MARPKKSDSAPEARDALVLAFWRLLKDNQLDQISIGMIARAAGYNRGTFYYYFADKDAFIEHVIESELDTIPSLVFKFITSTGGVNLIDLMGSQMERLSLIMRHGGRNIVERDVKRAVVAMWTALLSEDGRPVKPETRVILEYMTSGTLGLLSYIGSLDKVPDPFPVQFISDSSATAMRHICELEGVSQDEIVSRLRMLERFSAAKMG